MKKMYIFLSVTVLVNIMVRIVTKSSEAVSEWYAINIYPQIVNIAARITGLFPFSVSEMLIILFSVLFIVFTVRLIIKLRHGKGKRIIVLMHAVLFSGCVISALAMLFLFGCGINYNRLPFSYHSGISVSTYSKEDLRAVIDNVNQELSAICENIQTGENGKFKLRSMLNPTAREAMNTLGEQYPCLRTYYPRAKPLISSELYLSRASLCGIFSPFTIEANYNYHMPDSEKPFTVCHELSHLSGFMREDEANFVAYLACKASGDSDFLYSAYIKALTYSINAYFPIASEEEYVEVYSEIPYEVQLELVHINNYWKKYREKKFSKLTTQVNDTYLKVNGQDDGVQSYGRFVDLLIAEYKNPPQ